MKSLLVILFFCPLFSYGVTVQNRFNREVSVIKSIINRLNPSLSSKFTNRLAISVQKATSTHKICPRIYLAILMQESAFNMKAVGCATRGCVDFGISQINIATIAHYSLQQTRLMTDLDYAVVAGARILSDIKIKYSKSDKTWWSRYNSYKPTHRRKYEMKVQRWIIAHN